MQKGEEMQEITRIPLEGVRNTRDLGGFKTMEGYRIKNKKLIRSGELFDLTEGDKRILLEEYDLKTVVDFRTETERRERPDPVLPGVRQISNPILEEKAMGITREQAGDKSIASMVRDLLKGTQGDGSTATKYMEDIYRELLTNPFSRSQFRCFFQICLEQKEGALLWHCSAGKDRVGTGTMLLLSALGVSREQITADYMKVNEFAGEGIDAIVRSIAGDVEDENITSSIRTLFSVHESYMDSLYDTINGSFGSMPLFLKEEMGLTETGMAKLRSLYLEE